MMGRPPSPPESRIGLRIEPLNRPKKGARAVGPRPKSHAGSVRKFDAEVLFFARTTTTIQFIFTNNPFSFYDCFLKIDDN